MSKHLIYLGYTGEAHRVALFDENDFLVSRLPVKDIKVLSADLKFLNCIVVNGKPVPNLKGAKPLCSALGNDATHMKRHTLTKEDIENFKTFPGKEPEYLHGKIGDTSTLSREVLFGIFHYVKFWDGLSTDRTYYIIGEIALYKNTTKNQLTRYYLTISSEGDVFFLTSKIARILEGTGARFVQVGTPDLKCNNLYRPNPDGNLVNRHEETISLLIQKEQVPLVSLRGNKPTAETRFIWDRPSTKTVVLDLREYRNAKVFGIDTCSDNTSFIILPESIETLWLGMFNRASHLQAVYIPKNVEILREERLPRSRLTKVTIYSASPLVKAFCEVNNYTYKHCETADEALNDFYKEDNPDNIDILDASAIAGLTTKTSDKMGASGTIWTAVRFTFEDKGMARDITQSRYPIIEHCSEDLPELINLKESPHTGSTQYTGDYDLERIRLVVAGFTQFYPLTKALPENSTYENTYIIPLGRDYRLIVQRGALVQDSYYGGKRAYTLTLSNITHLALLQDMNTKKVIHRFRVSEYISTILRNLYGASLGNQMPSAVLRYATRLPAVNMGEYAEDTDTRLFSDELFKSYLPILYGVKEAKLRILGIDLYTGDIATMGVVIRHDYNFAGKTKLTSLLGATRVRNIQVHTDDESVADILHPRCAYLTRKEVRVNE